MKVRFSDIEIDPDNFEIRKNGDLVHVEPKVFNLLAHFVQHPDTLISSDELMEVVWKGRIVSDAAVVSCVANARKAIGDSGAEQRYIKTVRGRGFRFVAGLAAASEAVVSPALSPPPSASLPSSDSDPSMVIMPFQLLSTDTDITEGKQYLQALTSTLEIVLMRIPLLQLSPSSHFHNDPERLPTMRELHEHHGIDYILEGSVQSSSQRIVLNVQLSDAGKATRLWAEQFVLPGDFNSSLESGVVALIGKLEPQLHRAMYNRARSTSSSRDSRSLYLEASGILALKGWHHDSFSTASTLLRQSWQKDPDFAHAASYLSLVLGLGYRLDLLSKHKNSFHEAVDAAEAAIQLDDMNSSVLGLAGCALADLGYNDRGLLILRNAVELNPSNAQARSALGGVCLTTRQVKSAIKHLRQGMKMSPLDSRLSVWGGLLSTALRFSGDLAGAVVEARLACQYDHRAYMPQVVLSGAELSHGNSAKARAALGEAHRIKPDLTEQQIYCLLGRRLGAAVASLK